MICCKIIANYHSLSDSFSGIMSDLSKIGDVLWENGSIFFGCVDNIDISEKKIKNILKKYGCKNYFINIYSKDNVPQEGEYLNGWILDKIIKINYAQYEIDSQQVFANISKGLDILDAEIAQLRKDQFKDKEVES